MIEIYLDGNLIDSDDYMSFSYSYKMFDDTFYLGSTASATGSLQLPKESIPPFANEIVVRIDEEDYLKAYVDEIEISDDNKATIKFSDAMTLMQQPFDFSELVPINARQLLSTICSNFGIEVETEIFTNSDVEINSYDSSVTARDYIGMIAELAGGYAVINANGNLEIRKYENEEDYVITVDDVDSYTLESVNTIERVVYDTGTLKYETSSDESLYTVYLDTTNLFLQVITEEQFNALALNILNYSFSNIKIPNCNVFFKPGTLGVFVDLNENSYPIICNYECNYVGGFTGNYETNIKNTKQSETSVVANPEKIKRIKQVLDQTNNTLSITIAEQEHLTNRTSQLELDVTSIQNIFQITGGSNLIKNSQFLLTDETWNFSEQEEGDDNYYHTPLGGGYNADLIGSTVAIAEIKLRNCTATTNNINIVNIKKNITHTLNYSYELDVDTTLYVKLEAKNTKQVVFEKTYNTATGAIQNEVVQFLATDTDYTLTLSSETEMTGYAHIYDLMLNSGDKKSWEPAMSEVYSTVLKMSQLGVQVFAEGSETLTLLTSQGFKVYRASKSGEDVVIGEVITEFTKNGIKTKNVESSSITAGNYVMTEIEIDYTEHHVEYFK